MRLENAHYLVDVTGDAGLISRITDKRSGIELITEPRLADNFRLLIPLPGLEANYVLGKEQVLTHATAAGDSLALVWNGPLTNSAGSYDIDITLTISLAGDGIEIGFTLVNRSERSVDEIWYPVLGGVTGIGDREDTLETINIAGWSSGSRLFQHFPPGLGLGIPQPEVIHTYPSPMVMPWFDLSNAKLGRGVYIGVHDPVSRCKALRFELNPGVGVRDGDTWPSESHARPDLPIGMVIHWSLFPYVRPGESFNGPPVRIQFHDGDWHAAAAIYRAWFEGQFPIAEPASNWMYDEPGFLYRMCLLPEGNVKMRFADIEPWARTALEHGLTSVQLAGWNVGGHDGGYPDYTPDPRLGTWDDLKAAIDACHRLGVKVFFFVNTQPADTGTEWYRSELHRYRQISKHGEPVVTGWGMGSLGARLGFTRRPLEWMSTGLPEVRKLLVRQMEKLAGIGADGLHIDKLIPGGMDFNPLLTLSPDQAVSQGQLACVREIYAACRAINPDFAISAELAWDRLLEYTGAAWAWHPTGAPHVPVFKYTFPRHYLPNMSAPQPYDYTAVNNAMRYGYQIFAGPGNYTETLDYAPYRPLAAYIAETIRIRRELADLLQGGEFLDSEHAAVDCPECAGYGVFRDAKTGRRACVLVNYDRAETRCTVSGFENGAGGGVTVYLPYERPRASVLPISVAIPAERFAVVLEVPAAPR